AGEHQVQHDERGPLVSRRREGVGTGRRRRDAIPGLDEVERDEGDDVGLVVDDENALTRRPGVRHRLGGACASRRWILATIISIATGLWPPRGTITSA